jgi:hypothetical protein
MEVGKSLTERHYNRFCFFNMEACREKTPFIYTTFSHFPDMESDYACLC